MYKGLIQPVALNRTLYFCNVMLSLTNLTLEIRSYFILFASHLQFEDSK